MIVKLLTKHHLEFLSLKGGCKAHLSLHMSKCHIVRNQLLKSIQSTSPFSNMTCRCFLHYVSLFLNVLFSGYTESKKGGKVKESIQSSTTPNPGYQKGKYQKYSKYHQQEVSPFPAGDHKAAMNRCESMRNTRHKKILSSDVDQDTYIFGLHDRTLAYECVISKNI